MLHCIEKRAEKRTGLACRPSRETIGAPDAGDRLVQVAASRVNIYPVERGYELLTRIAERLIIGLPETT